jgi:hypothetical protein
MNQWFLPTLTNKIPGFTMIILCFPATEHLTGQVEYLDDIATIEVTVKEFNSNR